MRVLLILSETPTSLRSGGSVAGRERAEMLAGLCDLHLAYIDWDRDGPTQVNLGNRSYICRPISPESQPPGLALPFRIRRRLHARLGSLTHSGPWFFGHFSSEEVRRQVGNYLSTIRPDAVHFDNMPSTLAWDACVGHRRLYYAHNVEAEIVQYTFAQGWLRALERSRMRKHEARILNQANQVVCFTARDRRSLGRIAPDTTYHVIPPAFSQPLPSCHTRRSEVEPRYAILPTNATWLPNRLSLEWFATEVLPRMPRSLPFILTGRDHQGFLAGLEQRHPNMRYAGLLSREAYECLFREAAVFVNPTRYGSGFQIKLMEALRLGVPVVSTDFSNHIGDKLLSTDDPAKMADLIDRTAHPEQRYPQIDYRTLYEEARQGLATLVGT